LDGSSLIHLVCTISLRKGYVNGIYNEAAARGAGFKAPSARSRFKVQGWRCVGPLRALNAFGAFKVRGSRLALRGVIGYRLSVLFGFPLFLITINE
jgi:hypothetical protein